MLQKVSIPKQKRLLMACRSLAFDITEREGSARCGVLRHLRGQLLTPALLLYTRRGSPMYLTPDMVQELDTGGRNYILDVTKFLGSPKPVLLAKSSGKGRGFCALQDKFLVATNRDSHIYNYTRWEKGTKKEVRVDGFAGNRALTPDEYLTAAEVFEPDLVIPLSDEIPNEASDSRHRLSVDRSLMWLDVALQRIRRDSSSSARVLAPIQGGPLIDARRLSARECVKREGIFGYAICGMATGELPEQARACLEAVNDELPQDALRLVQGPLGPDRMLDAISQGADLLDATYATSVTSAGFALDLCSPSQPSNFPGTTKLNLLDTKFREDTGALVQGCQCFTCRNHSRAYVHHLLLVHEMTAQILLELHNTHQLLEWFVSIRKAIANGSFAKLKQEFSTGSQLLQTAC